MNNDDAIRMSSGRPATDAAGTPLIGDEAQLHALVRASSDVIYRMSPDWNEMRQLDGRGFLADAPAPTVDWWDEYIFPEDREHIRRVIGEAISAKATEEPTTPMADDPAVFDTGRLPGDDTPAQEPEEPENELIEAALLASAHRLDNVTVTHYCICQQCCGKAPDHPAYGITASGRRATPYVSMAVDPSVIPLGADVLVDYGDGEIHYYRADDTGSGVDGRHIDLCVGSHAEALRMGVKTATVYWVAQEE